MVNFYSRLIPDCATVTLPPVSINSDDNSNIELTLEKIKIITNLNELLVKNMTIAQPILGAELHLMVDAFKNGISSSLHPIGFS